MPTQLVAGWTVGFSAAGTHMRGKAQGGDERKVKSKVTETRPVQTQSLPVQLFKVVDCL